MKGFKTIAFGLAVAVLPAVFDYVLGVNWTSIGISPEAGAAIGVVIVGLRAATSTAIGKRV